MTARQELLDHLGIGVTTVCRAWFVLRRDGVSYGFTDHDRDLSFDGMIFRASSGVTARALQQTTGLSVDNSEAVGALSSAAVTEADLIAGRFDAAEVRAWLVNWSDTDQRIEQFRGNFGEISRSGGEFKAELRGLTDRLNQPRGRVFEKSCTAVLGDKQCGVDMTAVGRFVETPIVAFDSLGRMVFGGVTSFPSRWFERGRLTVLTGNAVDLVGMIKLDQLSGADRVVDLWFGLSAPLFVGDIVRLEAGCDRVAQTCKSKFNNYQNFRGFPHIPGEDWLTSYPVPSRPNDGGSLGN